MESFNSWKCITDVFLNQGKEKKEGLVPCDVGAAHVADRYSFRKNASIITTQIPSDRL